VLVFSQTTGSPGLQIGFPRIDVADAGMALAQSATTNKTEKLFFISLLKRSAPYT
jgi:hypothetical protein